IRVSLDKTLLLLVALVFIAVAATFWKGRWELTMLGLTQAGQLINTIWLRLLLGFILGGLVQVLIPAALIAKWLGHASGLKGILIGSYLGIILPGGPWITLPIIASIYRSGAGIGPIIALLIGRAMLGLHIILVWQIPFLGVEIPLARYIACLILPPLAGLAGKAVFELVSGPLPAVDRSARGVCNVEQPMDGTGDSGVMSEKSDKEERGDKWT
ncbi:permease, partial [Chloroflexota bacterium]